MSEAKQPASVLEGFILGDQISSHHGVRCCPAIREDCDDKYIVKIISIPATQGQLDALLLTGAYADRQQALAYFKELADGVAREADILQELSKLKGFDGHQGFEVRRLFRGCGYQITLVHQFKPSLAKLMHEQPLTHLSAVNLGLDLCAALSTCRQRGYLYVDLKPENVFHSKAHGYSIGDLGFLPLSSLRFASLPEKYRSRYTAPEVRDAMSSLNDTLDIYALGLLLYQVYNNCQLPFEICAPSTHLPPPMYADYEMAEIIMKACAPDPKDRWQSPSQMGQALVSYMQRNYITDTPIIPPPVIAPQAPEENEDFLTEEENDRALAHLLADLPEEFPPDQLTAESDRIVSSDETAPSEETSTDLTAAEVSEEVAQMLALADNLIAHELPEPVVAPAAIDVPMPALVLEEMDDTQELETIELEIIPEPAQPDTQNNSEADKKPLTYDTEDEYLYDLPVKRKPSRWIAAVAALLLVIAAGVGGYVWYSEFFLQSVDSITLQGSGDTLSVTLISDIDDGLLTIACTDTYGNTQRSAVSGGKAQFTGLSPATQYRIRVEISGLHQLEGSTTAIYTTATPEPTK